MISMGGCASLPGGAAPPGPERLTFLETRVAGTPGDHAARLELASAYRGSGRASEAVALVQPILSADQAHPEALFQLGLAQEAQGNLPEARSAYQRFLEVSPSPRLSRRVRGRLVLLRRTEVESAVREALAAEATLGTSDPGPGTVGVFPLLVGAADPELRPLGTALAVLLATDLGQTDRLRVLERVEIQSLLAELALAESARVDPATAARAGRLLRAGRVVQGRVDGDAGALRLQAYAVPAAATGIQGSPVERSGALADLFDLQKELALGLYEAMGIQLTPAERERVLQRHTRDLQALLSFGMGVEASDAGRFSEALQHFRTALGADPDFTLADTERAIMQDVLDVEGESVDELEELAWWEFGPGGIPWRHPRGRFAEVEALIPGPGGHPPFEGLGVGLDRRSILDITVPRPGGN